MDYYPRSPSPVFSSSDRYSDSSSDDGYPANGEYGEMSRPGSPGAAMEGVQDDNVEVDTMTCRWEECGKVFSHLPTMIEHIHNGAFLCMLSIYQFPLMSHRPYWCPQVQLHL